MPTEQLTQPDEAARFHDMIEGHPHLRVVAVDPPTQAVTFYHFGSKTAMEIARLPEQLEESGADVILGVLEGRINPKRMKFMTRIVGYFSRVDAWNRSKLAELRDRQKAPHRVPTGDYKLGGRGLARN